MSLLFYLLLAIWVLKLVFTPELSFSVLDLLLAIWVLKLNLERDACCSVVFVTRYMGIETGTK